MRAHEKLPKGACLVVSKHQSAWDTFALVPLFRDPAIVLKDELKWIPFYGWFCVKFEHILVKRDKAASALEGHDRATPGSAPRQGREIVIFPEGTRRPPGAPPDYKPGYVALYEGLELPCVPLALNSGLYWPRRSLMRYPGTIVVEFLDPLPPGMPRKEFRRGARGPPRGRQRAPHRRGRGARRHQNQTRTIVEHLLTGMRRPTPIFRALVRDGA